MMSSREQILGRIRTNASGTNGPQERADTVARRIRLHPKGIIPAGPEKAADVLARFVEKAIEASATVDVVKRSAIGTAISKFLRNHNLPQQVRMGTDRRLKKITWPKKGGPELRQGPSDGTDLAGLSQAMGGIAETGTLILLSGKENPTTINFLPENHIVVLEAKDLANDHETMWAKLRKAYGAGAMPRSVNMITGPSRSADIEQTLILGAHGPVRLHIIIVKD
jgi:L-lactate dehydrogenase complex protein LldG